MAKSKSKGVYDTEPWPMLESIKDSIPTDGMC